MHNQLSAQSTQCTINSVQGAASPQRNHDHLPTQEEFRHALLPPRQHVVDGRIVPLGKYLFPRQMTRTDNGDFESFAVEHDGVDEEDEEEEEEGVEWQGGVAQ